MITDIRRYLKSKAYKTVLWMTIIGLVIALVLPPTIRQVTSGTWVVKVNDEEISELAFRRKVAQQQEFLAGFRQQYGPYADFLLQSMGIQPDPRELAFQLLVQDELLNQVADQAGIYVHDDHMADKLADIRFVQQELGDLIPVYAFDQTGKINTKVLSAHLNRMGLSMSDFEHLVQRALGRALVRSLVIGSAYIPSFALKQKYIADYLGKKFSILTFSFDDYLKKAKETAVTDEELKSFYDRQNKQYKRYWVPEKRAGILWKFKPEAYGISVNDQEITTYYDDNKAKRFVQEPTKVEVRRILLKVPSQIDEQKVQAQAQQIQSELVQNPNSFAAKAKEVSDDKETASKGGLMPKFARGEKEQAFERTAFLLKKDGDVSSVIRTNEGYEILQRVSKQLQTYKQLKDVKDEIKNLLLTRKFKQVFSDDMKQALKSKNFDEFGQKKGAIKEFIKPMINDNTRTSQMLFKAEKGKTSFYIDEGIGYAVKLTDIEARYLPELAAIKDTVQGDLYEERAAKQMKAGLEKAKNLAQAKSMEALKDEFGATLKRTDWLKKDDSKAWEAMEKQGIPVNRMLQLEKTGLILTQMADQNGYLVRLDEIESFDPVQMEAKQAELEKSLKQERIALLSEGFVASLYRNATINVNESVLNLYREYTV